MPKNYYLILGVPVASSQAKIKAAYRKLAKEYHPDYYGDNKVPFQNLQEAYSVLSNPKSRRLYDKSLEDAAGDGPGQQVSPEQGPAEEIIEPLVPDNKLSPFDLFTPTPLSHRFRSPFDTGFGDIREEFRSRVRVHKTGQEDITVEIPLSQKQAKLGGIMHFYVPFKSHCPRCSGYGRPSYGCRYCNGAGILLKEQPVMLNYPAGLRDNSTLRLAVQGEDDEQILVTVIARIR